ncbi:LLM class flavin-dependent oxidoreductase [Mycobacterium hubeiense]|uniref:LLM class flavin-dependent oxidoreductase n=1 Tax=Mycobacterium hubeiense TaxID=1867256 RepID=UPI001E54F84B|nr:LLM class flavin-dependent oxidoreductase [Mycobacterium sp. QGD 101]
MPGFALPQFGEEFRASLDPFVALTVAATATTRVKLGSNVLVAAWYPPVQLARQLTSIAGISGGRLLPGFGICWSPEEYQTAGAPFRRRGAQLDEALDVLEVLWTTNPVVHHVDALKWQRIVIDEPARAAGRDPQAIHTYVRVNVAAGIGIEQVAATIETLADHGFPAVFVDLMFVVSGTDAHLEWVERLLAQ